jgi:6-phosphofructokinase 1
MDNDLNFAQTSYGFSTAVANGAEFIRTIHTGAESLGRLGVIELFGAGSGFVALHAANISGVADCVLMPELADVQTPDRVRAHLRRRMEKNGHAVLVVAEGAVKGFVNALAGAIPADARPGFDQGGAEQKAEAFDRLLAWLKMEVSKQGLVDARARYLMRDTAPNAADLELAKWSGKLLADTGLAGFSDCAVQYWQGEYVLVPFRVATARLKQVAPWSYFLQTLLDRERLALLGPAKP